MPIPFTCPHCGAHTDVDEKYAGTSGACFQCGQTVTVPSLQGSTPNVGTPVELYAAVAPPPRKTKTSTWVLVVSLALLGLCCLMGVPIALLLPAVQAARQAAWKAQCTNNLKQIGVALHNYHMDNGCFPPPYLTDENGTPMHSWRVLLLPYLERRDLYDRYDFDEPWNGPNNIQLENQIPEVFHCPSEGVGSEDPHTSYVAVVGPGLLFDPTKSVSVANVTDGTSNTIAVVESFGHSGTGVNWLSPDDLRIDTMNSAINEEPGPSIASLHRGGANVLIADGSVRFIREDFDPQTLQAMLTVAGGEASELFVD